MLEDAKHRVLEFKQRLTLEGVTGDFALRGTRITLTTRCKPLTYQLRRKSPRCTHSERYGRKQI